MLGHTAEAPNKVHDSRSCRIGHVWMTRSRMVDLMAEASRWKRRTNAIQKRSRMTRLVDESIGHVWMTTSRMVRSRMDDQVTVGWPHGGSAE